MAGISDIGHAEYGDNPANSIVTLVSCAVDNRPDGAPRLWGILNINIKRDSLAYRIYGKGQTEETFSCNYELNPAYRETIESKGLKVSGETDEGGARIIELPGHRFFIATGFLPQLLSEPESPHPLITTYLKAALDYNKERN